MSSIKYLDEIGGERLTANVKALLANKVDKVDGKQLSTEDFTSELKNSLETLINSSYVFTIPAGRMGGDVDGDGTFTMKDYYLISNHVSGTSKITDETALLAADTDGNGMINANDANMVSNFTLGTLAVPSYSHDALGNWSTDGAKYFYVDVDVEGITTTCDANIAINTNIHMTASVIEDGKVRLYCESLPLTAATAVISFSEGTGIVTVTNNSADAHVPSVLLNQVGIAYVSCTTALTEAYKTATSAKFNLVRGGLVSVRFVRGAYAVENEFYLNINGTGDVPVYKKVKNATLDITEGDIPQGHIALLVYDGTQYILLNPANKHATFTLPAGRHRGDVDGDGYITATDSALISGNSSNPITDEIARLCADVNGDTLINTNDSTFVNSYLAGNSAFNIGRFTDVLDNWTSVDSTGATTGDNQFYVDIAIGGLVVGNDVEIHFDSDMCFDAEIIADGTLRVYAYYLPLNEVVATITFREGTGLVSITNTESRLLPVERGGTGVDSIEKLKGLVNTFVYAYPAEDGEGGTGIQDIVTDAGDFNYNDAIGTFLICTFDIAKTGSIRLRVDGSATKIVRKADYSTVKAGDIVAGGTYLFVYIDEYWLLLNPSTTVETDVLYVNVTENDPSTTTTEGSCTSDVYFSEIKSAFDSGKAVIAKLYRYGATSPQIMQLDYMTTSVARFTCVMTNSTSVTGNLYYVEIGASSASYSMRSMVFKGVLVYKDLKLSADAWSDDGGWPDAEYVFNYYHSDDELTGNEIVIFEDLNDDIKVYPLQGTLLFCAKENPATDITVPAVVCVR